MGKKGGHGILARNTSETFVSGGNMAQSPPQHLNYRSTFYFYFC